MQCLTAQIFFVLDMYVSRLSWVFEKMFHSSITDVQLHVTQISTSKMEAIQGIYKVSYFYCSAQFCIGLSYRIRKDQPP